MPSVRVSRANRFPDGRLGPGLAPAAAQHLYMQLLLLMIQLLIYSAIGTSMVVHGVVLAAAIVVMLFCIPIWIIAPVSLPSESLVEV